jgi:cellulose synthase/poly-beta-1,6-N-acetylglucosamine synthase-like glycosyltransferase
MELSLTVALRVVYWLYLGLLLGQTVLQWQFARRHARRGTRGPGAWEPRVDVVVPCFDERPELLDACCASLRAQSYRPGGVHVYLVDDASPNRALLEPVYRRYEQLPGWTVIRCPSWGGKRRAQDAAVRRGTADLVVTIDSDTTVEPDGLRRIVASLERAEVGAVSGHVGVANAAVNRLTRVIEKRYQLRFEQERAAQGFFDSVLCCSGPFSVYRRAALERVWARYLDQRLWGRPCTAGDDIHLTNLVLAEGFETGYEAAARASTSVPETVGRYARQQLRWNRSFFRELRWTVPLLVARWRRRPGHPYVAVDVAARALLPLLLPLGLLLVAAHALLGGPQALADDLVLVAAMMVTHALFAVLQARELRFPFLYGLLYLLVLVPVRLRALTTLTDDRWVTRQARDRLEPVVASLE